MSITSALQTGRVMAWYTGSAAAWMYRVWLETVYQISVERDAGPARVEVDGLAVEDGMVPLANGGGVHAVKVYLKLAQPRGG